MQIFEDDTLRVIARHEQSRTKSNSVLLSFTGIGHANGDVDIQNPEFFATGRTMDNSVFIIDKTRSWSNLLDFDAIRDMISPFIGDRTVYAIGNSMGGFNAIISTRYIPARVCVAFAPQFSVNPDIVPWERRWKTYTSKIGQYRFDSVRDHLGDPTEFYIFSGAEGPDQKHAALFPVRDNVHHFAVHDSAHDVAKRFKQDGVLLDVVQKCFSGDGDPLCGLGYHRLSPADA